jgi:hypothetical protein
VITLKKGGVIQSETINNGKRDFILKSNGEAVLNNATIRGHIEANSGYIKNITTINLTAEGTLNDVPITGYAKNHPISSLYNDEPNDINYPVGSIILAGVNTLVAINTKVDVYHVVSSSGYQYYDHSINGKTNKKLP